MNRIWQHLGCGAFLRYPAYEFKGKERIAPRTLHHPLPERLIQSRRHVFDQLPRLDHGERLQGQGGEVLLSSTPGRTAVQ